jgi:hypothetical protein
MRKSHLEAEIEREEGLDQVVRLNLDQVRQERGLVQPRSEPNGPSQPSGLGGPTTELGKKVWDVLFNPSVPHPDHIDFKKNIDLLVRHCSKLPVGESLANKSHFFNRTKYLFTHESELPVTVMKNMEELEAQLEADRDRIPVRYDSEIIEMIRKGRKSKKIKPKDDAKTLAPQEDEDFDMFGGFKATRVVQEETEGPIFEVESSTNFDDDIKAVREALRARATKHVAEDNFGEKLDVSKFGIAEDDGSPKHKKRKENEIFQKVMKRLE